jgi:Xaa-Pro aminopeptidase
MDASSGAAKLESAQLESAKLELIMSFGEDRIIRKSPEEIEKMRRSGKMVRQVLNHLKGVVAAGVTTMDLEQAAEKLIAELGAAPAFQGYYG